MIVLLLIDKQTHKTIKQCYSYDSLKKQKIYICDRYNILLDNFFDYINITEYHITLK